MQLPDEDWEEGMCGKLLKSMYGTRDAAQNWEKEYSGFMTSSGFETGKANPCVFYHREKSVRAVIHGDDFTLLGHSENLDWFRKEICNKFEVKMRGRLGPEESDDKSIRILNRVVEWNSEGIKYEADQRHADIIVEMMGLDESSKALRILGANPNTKHNDNPFSDSDATLYRAVAARANYLGQDRSDTQFAVREVSRYMSSPTVSGMQALKHLPVY